MDRDGYLSPCLVIPEKLGTSFRPHQNDSFLLQDPYDVPGSQKGILGMGLDGQDIFKKSVFGRNVLIILGKDFDK